jgi:signal transduction histidine kinase
LVAPAANKQATQLAFSIDAPPTLALPSTLVRQLLINLMLNAIAAAGHGGRVAVRANAGLTQLVLVVENNGKTLSPEQLTTLFEPFTRFSEHGHGLGLWICYRIVTGLRGTIRAESTDNLTRFTVTLPLDSLNDSRATENLPD